MQKGKKNPRKPDKTTERSFASAYGTALAKRVDAELNPRRVPAKKKPSR